MGTIVTQWWPYQYCTSQSTVHIFRLNLQFESTAIHLVYEQIWSDALSNGEQSPSELRNAQCSRHRPQHHRYCTSDSKVRERHTDLRKCERKDSWLVHLQAPGLSNLSRRSASIPKLRRGGSELRTRVEDLREAGREEPFHEFSVWILFEVVPAQPFGELSAWRICAKLAERRRSMSFQCGFCLRLTRHSHLVSFQRGGFARSWPRGAV